MGLFGNKSHKYYQDFTPLASDMHSHLLPGVDDGSASIDESLAMIAGLKRLGFTYLVTTPHINSDLFDNSQEIINLSYQKLANALNQEHPDVTLDFAAEYFLNYDFLEFMHENHLLTFGKNYLLLEFSFHNPPLNLHEIIFQIQSAGYTIVLAHPERYLYWYNQPEQYSELSDRGVLLQVNLGSFAGRYNMQVQQTAEKLAQNNLIDLLGTDLHSPAHLDVLEKALANKYLQKIMAGKNLMNSRLATQKR